MVTADRELLSRTARNAVRGLMSDLVAGAIGEYWENEHFAPAPGFTPVEGGVRKQLFDSYAASVDWTDHDHVTRALRVFESMLRRLDRESRKYGGDGLPADTVADLREAFARDGSRLDDPRRPAPRPWEGRAEREGARWSYALASTFRTPSVTPGRSPVGAAH